MASTGQADHNRHCFSLTPLHTATRTVSHSFALLSILAVGVSAVLQICTDPRVTRQFVAKSLFAIAVFLLHAAIGGGVVFFLLPHGPGAALGVTLAFIGWLALGTLGLVRLAPRLRTPSAWLLHFGVPDFICLLLILIGLGLA